MRFPIKLGKKHFPNEMLRISESWMGNGYWMAKKKFFSNAHLFDSDEKTVKELFPFIKSCGRVKDTNVGNVLPVDFSKIKRFVRTDWAHFGEKEFDQVLFTGPENEGLFLDKLYAVDMFDLDFVYFFGGETVVTVDVEEREKVSIIIGRMRGLNKLPPSCTPVEEGEENVDDASQEG